LALRPGAAVLALFKSVTVEILEWPGASRERGTF
jgi:hypothetical protein